MPETRTYKDRREYNIRSVTLHRQRRKQQCVEYKGGECILCGYKKCLRALSFHHLDPLTKEFELNMRFLSRAWEKIKKELDKCVLLCSNCHMEVHAGVAHIAM